MQKIIVVCGPTAVGKSDYAVELAHTLKTNGIQSEIISADSRQVYRGLDIGSGKITVKEMKGIPHHMLDVASPKRIFSVAQYKKQTETIIKKLFQKNIIPIIVGGTGFYIDAVVYDQQLPAVPANKILRKELEKLSLSELQQILQSLDIDRYLSIDIYNRVRLIRAIEIAKAIGKVPRFARRSRVRRGEGGYDVEWIYLDISDDELKKRIHDRVIKRMKQGMVKEVEQLHKEGLSWKRLESLGLEYRFIALYLQGKPFDSAQGKLSIKIMMEKLETASWQYVKRQRTWFKKYAK